ncbi:hypothetical protein N9C80_02465 [Paracoccaceae bacterium]|nr:hypothetical protein [Paracoccaceae bacterium]
MKMIAQIKNSTEQRHRNKLIWRGFLAKRQVTPDATGQGKRQPVKQNNPLLFQFASQKILER